MVSMSDSIKRLIKRIEEYYDVSITVKPQAHFDAPDDIGYALCDTSEIFLSKTTIKSKKEFLCTTLHEVCHILCYRRGIYKIHHSSKLPSQMTKRECEIECRTGLKAERYVDKLASFEIKKWDNRIKYDFNYSKPDVAESFKRELIKYKK